VNIKLAKLPSPAHIKQMEHLHFFSKLLKFSFQLSLCTPLLDFPKWQPIFKGF
jgi:hypothetical protein